MFVSAKKSMMSSCNILKRSNAGSSQRGFTHFYRMMHRGKYCGVMNIQKNHVMRNFEKPKDSARIKVNRANRTKSEFLLIIQSQFCTSCKGSSSSEKIGDERPLIQLFTKSDCSLCEIAKESLEPFLSKCDLEEVDIEKEENRVWFEKYKYDIPVIHLNGKFLMKHKVFSSAFQDALDNLNKRKITR